jgi:hypothetical protein
MDTSTKDTRPDWLRFWFFIFETALLAAFFFNEVLPRWYVAERLGRGGNRWSARFWSGLFDSIYHLDGPKPHTIYAVIYWISLAGLLMVCFGLRRGDPSRALIGWVTAFISFCYILLAPKFQPKIFEIWASRRSALPLYFGRGERRESLDTDFVRIGR